MTTQKKANMKIEREIRAIARSGPTRPIKMASVIVYPDPDDLAADLVVVASDRPSEVARILTSGGLRIKRIDHDGGKVHVDSSDDAIAADKYGDVVEHAIRIMTESGYHLH